MPMTATTITEWVNTTDQSGENITINPYVETNVDYWGNGWWNQPYSQPFQWNLYPSCHRCAAHDAERKPYACPVCKGEGTKRDKQCHPCEGKGVLWG